MVFVMVVLIEKVMHIQNGGKTYKKLKMDCGVLMPLGSLASYIMKLGKAKLSGSGVKTYIQLKKLMIPFWKEYLRKTIGHLLVHGTSWSRLRLHCWLGDFSKIGSPRRIISLKEESWVSLSQNARAECGMDESSCHIFFVCPFFFVVWQKILSWLSISSALHNTAISHLDQFIGLLGRGRVRDNIFSIIWFAC